MFTIHIPIFAALFDHILIIVRIVIVIQKSFISLDADTVKILMVKAHKMETSCL